MEYDGTTLGLYNTGYEAGVPLVLDAGTRRRHVYVCGASGVGKSTLLYNLAIQDIESGSGFALIDPHGDLAEAIIDAIPPERTNQVCYLCPSDVEHPVAFNVLEDVAPDVRAVAADGMVSAFKSVWFESWGPRLEHILRHALVTLIEYPSGTLLMLPRLLTDEAFRERIVGKVSDPIVRNFWSNEFAQYNERFRTKAVAPILNKVGAFLASPAVRHILGQGKSRLHLDRIIAKRRILIVNLAKGLIGESAANLMGSLILTRLHLAGMARAALPSTERHDFHIVIDECQNFGTDTFAAMLAESRKMGLSLVMANQHLAQLTPAVRAAVLGNVASLMVFRVGAEDAELFSREFAPLRADVLKDLPPYQAWGRIGMRQHHIDLLPERETNAGRREVVIKQSRIHFARARSEIEGKIGRFFDQSPSP